MVGLPVSWRLPTWFLTAVKLEPRESKTEEKSMKVSDETQAEALAANLHSAISMFTATYCELTSGSRDRLLDCALMEWLRFRLVNRAYR